MELSGNQKIGRWAAATALTILSLMIIRSSFETHFAEMLIESSASERMRSIAQALDPNSPEVQFSLGKFHLNNAENPNPAKAAGHFKKAAELSPYSYRIWIELGMAEEAAGRFDAAREAIDRAGRLAPKSFECVWTKANYLIRRRQIQASLKHFLRAAEMEPSSLPQAMDLIFRANGGNVSDVQKIVPQNSIGKMRYAVFLAKEGDPDEAFEQASKIPVDPSDSKLLSVLRELSGQLHAARHYRNAKTIWLAYASVVSPQIGSKEIGQFFNGSFDYSTRLGYFDWSISDVSDAAIEQSLIGSDGKRGALGISFKKKNIDFIGPSQLIPVVAGRRYRLEFRKKSNGLTTESRPFVEVYDANNPQFLSVASSQLGASEEWNKDEIVFQTGLLTDAIVVRIRRKKMEKFDSLIEGTAAFDDFELREF